MLVLRKAFTSKAFSPLRLTLLSTDHCPLCVHFKQQLQHYLNTHVEASHRVVLQEKNIVTDAELFEGIGIACRLVMDDKLTSFVAVHAGAGTHRFPLDSLCAKAIKASYGSIVRAVKILEDDPSTNAGIGSNLTIDGCVECEAAFFSSNQTVFGAVGAVSRIRNPVVAAYKLAKEQLNASDRRLIAPSVLVSGGAEQWAQSKGVEMCEPNKLIVERSLTEWKHAKSLIEGDNDQRLDTVGAVSVGVNGECSAACSSGGIMLKKSGRLGHATQIGGAVWAEQKASRSVAVSLSGCGEFIAKTCLAQKIAQGLLEWKEDEEVVLDRVRDIFEKDFIRSPLLAFRSSKRVLAGGLVLIYDSEERSRELIAFHNTEHLPFAFGDGSNIRKAFSKRTSLSPFIIHSFPSYFCEDPSTSIH